MSELKRTCVDCGEEFTLSSGEISFYKSKGYALPKRCESCRKARKQEKEKPAKEEQQTNKPAGTNANAGGGNKKEKGSLKKKFGAIAAAVIVVVAGAAGASQLGGDNIDPPVTAYEDVTDAAPQDVDETAVYDVQNTTGEDIFNEENYTSGGTYSQTVQQTEYYFRSDYYLDQHYEKHGKEMGFASPEEYEAAASAVINNPDALTKTEKEDGDCVYYVEATNEFVILSTDGYIRTYFEPDDGLAYFNRQ